MNKKLLDEAWHEYEIVMDKHSKISSGMKDTCKHFFYLGAGFTAMNFKKQSVNMMLELAAYFCHGDEELNNFFRENIVNDSKNQTN